MVVTYYKNGITAYDIKKSLIYYRTVNNFLSSKIIKKQFKGCDLFHTEFALGPLEATYYYCFLLLIFSRDLLFKLKMMSLS